MKTVFIFYVITLVFFCACKPELAIMTKKELNNYQCETFYYTDKQYCDLGSFKSEFKKKNIFMPRTCKCDTIYFDILDIEGYRNQKPEGIFGVCTK